MAESGIHDEDDFEDEDQVPALRPFIAALTPARLSVTLLRLLL